jgi:hypothetical protein
VPHAGSRWARSGGSREGARFAQTVALVSIHTVTASPTTPRCRSLVRTQWWSRLHVPLASPPHAVVQPGPRFHRVRWDGPSTARGWPWAAGGLAADGSERPPTKGSVPAPASWRSGDADAGHPGGDEPERRDGGSRRGVTECIGGRQERLEAHQHLFRGPRTIDELRLPAYQGWRLIGPGRGAHSEGGSDGAPVRAGAAVSVVHGSVQGQHVESEVGLWVAPDRVRVVCTALGVVQLDKQPRPL